MDGNAPPSPDEGDDSHQNDAPPALYRLGSNMSRSSIFEDVEMAHEEVRRMPVGFEAKCSDVSLNSSCIPDLSPRACPRAYLPFLIEDHVPIRRPALCITTMRPSRLWKTTNRTVRDDDASLKTIFGEAFRILATWSLESWTK